MIAPPPEAGPSGRPATPPSASGWPTDRWAARLLVTGLSAAGALGASIATASTPLLGQNVFLLYLVVVLSSALVGGLVPGLAAALTSVFGAGYFLYEPTGAFHVAAVPDRARLGLLLITTILVAVLSQALRTMRRRVAERERALRASEESYRALFDNSADALYILDRGGMILEANRAAGTLYGVPASELAGIRPSTLSDPERTDAEAARSRIDRAFRGGSERFEWWGRRADGTTFPQEIALSRASYFGRTVVLAVARDLTDQRALEEQLRQSQKMEAVGRLAGGVSHDFNNLLTTIRGHATLVAEALPADDPLRDDVGEIERAADLATHVTRQLLAFSRAGDRGEPRTVPLDPVVDGLERMLRRVIGVDVGIRLELAAGSAAVRLDPGHLEQVLINLVVNARDAMPDGGTITIGTSADPPNAGVPDARKPRWVHLEVRDTGIGMDAETLERVFEPFYTTKQRGEGTGLGLSTVYGIVQQSGGRIRIESEPGRGTRFLIDLPVADSGPADAAGAADAAAEVEVDGGKPDGAETGGADSVGRHRGTILLVEDEGAVRALMARVLTRSGYDVVQADGAEQAWRRFAPDPTRFDLVLTDVAMPGERGPQLARRIRERAPSLPVLFASGSDGLDPAEALPGGGDDFLQKPFTPAELERAVRSMIEEAVPAG